jgi:hypothetical protein
VIDDGGAFHRGERAFPSTHIGGRPFDAVRRVAGPGAVHQAHEAATAGEFGGEGGARGPGAEDDVEIAVNSGAAAGAALAGTVLAWSQLHGTVSLEVAGQYAGMGHRAGTLLAAQIDSLADAFRLP